MMKAQGNSCSRCSGFTMVEVLVTIVVMAVGLLGVAGMQTASMKGNYNSYLRGQAILMVNDIADRMRVNQTGVDNNNYAAITATPSTPAKNCLGSVNCTPSELASYDAWAWRTSIAAMMTSGAGTLQCLDTADPGYVDADSDRFNDADTDGDACTDGSSYLATISWNENDIEGSSTKSIIIEINP